MASCHYANPSAQVTGSLEALLGESGHKVRDIQHGVPTNCRTQSHTCLHTRDNLEMSVMPTTCVFGLRRKKKPKYPKKNFKTWKKHTNSTHGVQR